MPAAPVPITATPTSIINHRGISRSGREKFLRIAENLITRRIRDIRPMIFRVHGHAENGTVHDDSMRLFFVRGSIDKGNEIIVSYAAAANEFKLIIYGHFEQSRALKGKSASTEWLAAFGLV